MRIGLGLLVAGVLSFAFAPAASAAELEFVPASGFKVEGTNGYTVYVQYGRGGIFVGAKRGRRSVSYYGRATIAPHGHRLDAELGEIADFHVTFHRTKVHRYVWETCGADEYARGEFGYYTGTIRFRGELGYTEVDVTRAPSLPWRSSCSSEGASTPGSGARLYVFRDTSEIQTRFKATENRRGRPVRYFASMFEQVDGVQILRVIQARARTGYFIYDRPVTRAVLRTPRPFDGRLILRRGAGGRLRLRGSVQASFPGRPDVPLTGAGQQFAYSSADFYEGRSWRRPSRTTAGM